MTTVVIPVACDEHFVYCLVSAEGFVIGLYCQDCDQEYEGEIS
jgi:hypothetical protein